jgi:hypothetical protein
MGKMSEIAYAVRVLLILPKLPKVGASLRGAAVILDDCRALFVVGRPFGRVPTRRLGIIGTMSEIAYAVRVLLILPKLP